MQRKERVSRQLLVYCAYPHGFFLLLTLAVWLGKPCATWADDGMVGPSSSATAAITLTIPRQLSVQVSPAKSSGASRATTPDLQVTSNLGDIRYSLRRIKWKGAPQPAAHNPHSKQRSDIEVVTYIVVPEE